MALWETIAADGPAAWFDTEDFGRNATYTPVGGIPADCTVAIKYGAQPAVDRSPIAQGRSVRYLFDEAVLVCAAAEVSAPKFGDLFAVDGRTWKVQEVLEGNGVHWRLRLEAGARASHS